MTIDNSYSTGDILPASWVVDVADAINDDCVQKTGATMTGHIKYHVDPVADDDLARKAYVDAVDLARKSYVDTQNGLYLPLTGGTMSGHISYSVDPTSSNHLARKGYVDSTLGNYLAKTGGTMSGHISYSVDPTSSSHLARKSYVDNTANAAKDDNKVAEDRANSSLPDPTTSNQYTGCDITMTRDDDAVYLITATFDFAGGDDNYQYDTCVGYLQIDTGAVDAVAAIYTPVASATGTKSSRATVSQTWVHSANGAGSVRFRTIYKKASNISTVKIEGLHTNLSVIQVGDN